jgi:RraA family protein
MAGTALTVRTAGGDNLVIHQALELIRPGDVIVVDGGGDTGRALVGEIMASIAAHRGAAGFVIDGAVRDAGVLAKGDFPCFARAAIHRGPYKNGPGAINVPVTIGGMVVSPGDIVVGDEDGVVAFPQAIAGELLSAVRAQEAREAEILKSIREGRYTGAYAKKAE